MVYTPEKLRPRISPLVPGERVIIREMSLNDVEGIAQLERRCYTLPWNASAYSTEVGNPAAYYSVAVSESGVILGYAGLWVVMDEAHITTIAVDPDARGIKIGEHLLLDLMEGCIERGARRATLEVREHNAIAHNLYKKFGFRDVAIRRHYYSDNGENAIIMWADYLTGPKYQKLLDQRREALDYV